MIAAISGAGGFIGRSLARKLRENGWTVRVMNRDAFSMTDGEFTGSMIEGADIVINLAGAPVSKRWTPAYKQEILDSRILTTRKIASAIVRATKKPFLLISASAIGIYDSQGTHTESSTAFGDTFLAEVCRQWEAEAMAAGEECRVVLPRLGVVLGKDGGALESMYRPFSIGLGGKIGNGKQPVSFIHIDDLAEALLFLIGDPSIGGPVNLVSPYPTDNAEFTDILAKVMHQPAWLTIPAFALKLMFGEGARILLEGQRVIPEKLEQAGFRFRYPTMRNALAAIYR